MLKLSLEDQIKFDNRDMEDLKTDLAASGERKSVAESSLAVESKDLTADTKALEDLTADCEAKRQEYDAYVVKHASELKALAGAKKALSTSEGEVVSICPNADASFLQISASTSKPLAVVRFIRDLA